MQKGKSYINNFILHYNHFQSEHFIQKLSTIKFSKQCLILDILTIRIFDQYNKNLDFIYQTNPGQNVPLLKRSVDTDRKIIMYFHLFSRFISFITLYQF